MLGNNRGEGKAGCLLMLLLVVISLFLGYKIAPVYMDKINFEDEMARIEAFYDARTYTLKAEEISRSANSRERVVAMAETPKRVAGPVLRRLGTRLLPNRSTS